MNGNREILPTTKEKRQNPSHPCVLGCEERDVYSAFLNETLFINLTTIALKIPDILIDQVDSVL